MRKLILVGFYDENNFGDDLLLALLLHYFPNYRCLIVRRTLFDKVIDKILGTHNARHILLSRFSELFIFIGGSIFQDSAGSERWFDKEVRKYCQLRCPYAILNANYGPERTKAFRAKVEQIIRGAFFVSFRDHKSYELFKHLPSTHFDVDLGFSLKRELPRKRDKNAVVSVVGPKKWWNAKQIDDARRTIKNHILSLQGKNYQITIFAACEKEGDVKEAEYHLSQSYGHNLTIFTHRRLDESLALLQSAHFIIGTRLHVAVAGLAYGTPIIPIIYDDKITEVLKTVDYITGKNNSATVKLPTVFSPDILLARLSKTDNNALGSNTTTV